MLTFLRQLIFALWLSLFCLSAVAGSYGFTDESDFSYESLVELITENKVMSVEAALAEIKRSKPELFETYVLMYRSKSLQKASFLAPRALLFEGSGRLVVSFNGDPTDVNGYSSLEVMQFRDETQSFEFREIILKEGRPAAFSKPNPAKCMQCHQSAERKNVDPRPNWEPYNVWPGAYGSDFGRVNPMSRHDILQLDEQDRQHVEDQAKEYEMVRKFFREVKPNHPRYKFLGLEHLSSSKATERDYNTFAALTKNFTDILGRLNARRVIRMMKTQWAPQWDFLKFTIGGIAKCGKLFMDRADLSWHLKRVPDEFIAVERGIDRGNIQVELARFERQLRQQGMASEEIAAAVLLAKERMETEKAYSEFRVSKSIWVLFEPFGISIRDWSMDFQTQGRLAAFERFGLPSNSRDAFGDALKLVAPEVAQYSCEELELKSLEGLRAYRMSSLFTETIAQRELLEQQREPLIQRCIGCHSHGMGVAPDIAFDDEDKLRTQLRRSIGDRSLLDEIKYRLSDHATLEDQMPRGLGRPSLDDRRALIDYLESLLRE